MQGMIGVRMESCGSASSPFVKDSSWHGPHTPWFVWVVIDQIMALAKRLPPPSWRELSDDTHTHTHNYPPWTVWCTDFGGTCSSNLQNGLGTSAGKSIFLTSMTTIWIPLEVSRLGRPSSTFWFLPQNQCHRRRRHCLWNLQRENRTPSFAFAAKELSARLITPLPDTQHTQFSQGSSQQEQALWWQ